MSQSSTTQYARQRTGWTGWIVFAAFMMILGGAFNVIQGLTAIFRDELFVKTPGGALLLDVTGWGWVHLILGLLLIAVGLALTIGQTWARVMAIPLVAVNAITELTFLPSYPIWSVVVITMDVLIAWAIIVHGGEMRSDNY
jgi:vacuolar-type H+-ATPase subunit I/STV1